MSKKTVSTAQVEIDSPAGEVGGPLCPPCGGMVMGRGRGGGRGGRSEQCQRNKHEEPTNADASNTHSGFAPQALSRRTEQCVGQ